MADLSRFRSEFPILERRTYLISASLGPLSRRSRDLAQEHLDLWQALGPEELWMEHGFPRLQQCRESFAALIGADPDEVAIVPSVSSGLSSIASCLAFTERNKIVISELDFPTNHYVWRAQQDAGAKVDVVASRDGIGIEADDVVERIDDQTAVVNVNRALYESGYLMDLPPAIAAAHDAGAWVVVDDLHATGIVPLDVHALGIDFLVSGALKWLCGGQGISFLYCRRDLVERVRPRVVGWLGTTDPFSFDRSELKLRPDARRFETGTFPLPQAWTAAGGMEIVLEAGVEEIRRRSLELTASVIRRADDLGLEVRTPRSDERRGGLVRVRVPGGPEAAESTLRKLLDEDVVVDRRSDCLRIAPHFFNDESDLDRCFAVLKNLI